MLSQQLKASTGPRSWGNKTATIHCLQAYPASRFSTVYILISSFLAPSLLFSLYPFSFNSKPSSKLLPEILRFMKCKSDHVTVLQKKSLNSHSIMTTSQISTEELDPFFLFWPCLSPSLSSPSYLFFWPFWNIQDISEYPSTWHTASYLQAFVHAILFA